MGNKDRLVFKTVTYGIVNVDGGPLYDYVIL